jgi:hypothetical protein
MMAGDKRDFAALVKLNNETSLLPIEVRQRVAYVDEFVALYSPIETTLTRTFSFKW